MNTIDNMDAMQRPNSGFSWIDLYNTIKIVQY
jgi:hypothetical protein